MHFPRPQLLTVRRRAADADGAVADTGPGPVRAPRRGRLEATEQRIVELATDRCRGIDVLLRNPPVRAREGSAMVEQSVWTARATLDEIGGRADLVATNAALLTAGLRAAARIGHGTNLHADNPGQAPMFAAVAIETRFAADETFLATVKADVRRVGLEPCQLLLSVAPDPELTTVWPSLQRLRSHGVRIALEQHQRPTTEDEDLLHRLPFDLVRVATDRALDGPDGEPTPSPLLRNLLAMGRRVWVEEVADGAALAALRAAGCELGSGPVFEPR